MKLPPNREFIKTIKATALASIILNNPLVLFAQEVNPLSPDIHIKTLAPLPEPDDNVGKSSGSEDKSLSELVFGSGDNQEAGMGLAPDDLIVESNDNQSIVNSVVDRNVKSSDFIKPTISSGLNPDSITNTEIVQDSQAGVELSPLQANTPQTTTPLNPNPIEYTGVSNAQLDNQNVEIPSSTEQQENAPAQVVVEQTPTNNALKIEETNDDQNVNNTAKIKLVSSPQQQSTAEVVGTQDQPVSIEQTEQSLQSTDNAIASGDMLDDNSKPDDAIKLADQPARNTDENTTFQLAQKPNLLLNPPKTVIPGLTGTVQIRKPLKIFTREELIRNLSFRDTPIKEVIGEIARRGNLNIIIHPSVTAKITGELRDVTLNEALDNVLAAGGLEYRILNGNSVIVGTKHAMTQLGLNRVIARAFRLSYAHPLDVSYILAASVFNRGAIVDFLSQKQTKYTGQDADQTNRDIDEQNLSDLAGAAEGGGKRSNKGIEKTSIKKADKGVFDDLELNNESLRPDLPKVVKGTSREQVVEGTGYNAAATDPGSQQIRAFQEQVTDFSVDQNGGGTIVVPDVKGRQVLVIGTAEDIQVAEESIKLIDKRPKQVHIQASLVEIRNEGIRQLGANLRVQGEGASGNLLGSDGVPLVQYLPGLGSPGNTVTPGGFAYTDTATGTGAPVATTFTRTQTYNYAQTNQLQPPVDTTPAGITGAYTGIIGALLPLTPGPIAGVSGSTAAQSVLNFLTLGKKAGGRANIATLPTALNLSINLMLQSNKARIIANPSVVVVDNTESLITIASEVVHKITSTVSLGVVSNNVELTKAGIFLDVLPRVTEDGFIVMRLRPSISAPLGAPLTFGGGATVVTLLSVREIMTSEVRVKDGQTLVLGGLFQEQEAANIGKVPYLAEAPVLGALFRNTLKGRQRTELMLLLTPKIVEEEPPSVSDTNSSTTM